MFEGIIGNEKIKKQLFTAIEFNRYSHSYLFLGISGIGKKMIAREFARKILCEDFTTCDGTCKSCLEFNTNNNPDFQEIIPDGNNIKIEQIRELQRKIVEPPIISQKKVYILDDADTLTREAQNCLLKTLEEPPEFAVIILIGVNGSNFLSTIKSRCSILQFEALKKSEIEKYLNNKYGLKDENSSIIEASCGSIGKVDKIVEHQELYGKIQVLINNLEEKSLIDVFTLSEFIYKAQSEKQEILDYINILLSKKVKQNVKYANCINIIEDTKKRIKANSNYNMSIDNMLMSIWEEIH